MTATRQDVPSADVRPSALARRPYAWAARSLPHGLPVLNRVVHAGIGRAFGPAPVDNSVHRGDHGLFGPGSATWHVIGESAALVGGVRALVVQLLHPLAMAGVADHSSFADDPLGRLNRTAGYVTTVAFGALDDVLAVSHGVRTAHTYVHGTAPDDTPYRASDPYLLRWVSIALTSSFLAADRAYAPDPVRGPRADAFVAEQSYAAALLDPRVDLDALAADLTARDALARRALELPMIDDGSLPKTIAELAAAFASHRDELDVNDQGREGFSFLLDPPIPVPMRAGYRPLLAGALATLPRDLRALLGLRTSRARVALDRSRARTLTAAIRLGAGRSRVHAIASERAAGPVDQPETSSV